MKYRKKPIVIEAWQWRGEEVEGYERRVLQQDEHGITKAVLIIPTLEGDMQASEFDFIITGVKGEVYPCKPDIFWATYEPVMDEESAPV